jgi:hypothetical protein
VAHSPADLLTTSDAESPSLADSYDLSPSHFRAGSASKSRLLSCLLLPGGGSAIRVGAGISEASFARGADDFGVVSEMAMLA